MTPLERAVRDSFRPRSHVPRVGLELELFPVWEDTGQPVRLAQLRSALGRLADTVTFEPGGQLELSPPCSTSCAALLASTRAQLARLRDACSDAGIVLVAAGTHPAGPGSARLEVQSPRYVHLQRHFDRIGTAGRRMMRETAALQVCVDLLPGDAAQQWNAAIASAPVLARMLGTGTDPTLRTRIWLAVDPARTAHDGRLLGPDPVRTYGTFALDAPSISPGHRRATVAHHLSTLFPPVRPRGYLELRALDAQPDEHLAGAVVLSAALNADPTATRDVLDLLGTDQDTLVHRWQLAAGSAPNDDLFPLSRQLLDVARAALERAPALDPPGAALDAVVNPHQKENQSCTLSSSA